MSQFAVNYFWSGNTGVVKSRFPLSWWVPSASSTFCKLHISGNWGIAQENGYHNPNLVRMLNLTLLITHNQWRSLIPFRSLRTNWVGYTKLLVPLRSLGAWLSERLRRWSNKPDVVGSIPVTTEFFLISCDSNQVLKWFGTHFNLEVPL